MEGEDERAKAPAIGQPASGDGGGSGSKAPEGEHLSCGDVHIPIRRAGMPDLFIALDPPEAAPYIMAPRDCDPGTITAFFNEQLPKVEELQADMRKRFAKSPARKCRYQTGDVAYVLGRPFQLRVHPLNSSRKRVRAGARGRSTAKYSIDPAVSLITLYVVHPGNYDEGKLAFEGYGHQVLLNNAKGLARDFAAFLTPGQDAPPVRMRAMRGRWSSDEAGAIWLSDDLIPYPPDCLVYVLWNEIAKRSELPQERIDERFAQVLPGAARARELLAERPEPFSLQ